VAGVDDGVELEVTGQAEAGTGAWLSLRLNGATASATGTSAQTGFGPINPLDKSYVGYLQGSQVLHARISITPSRSGSRLVTASFATATQSDFTGTSSALVTSTTITAAGIIIGPPWISNGTKIEGWLTN
jgi:hypothetical protein